MAPARAFSLRFRNQELRTLVREVATALRVSQNELIEQAVAHEMVFRGGRLADDLTTAARRLSELTEQQYTALLDRSIERFVQGERQREPHQAVALHSVPSDEAAMVTASEDPLGVLAAFAAGSR